MRDYSVARSFVEFGKEEVDQSIPSRFEQQALRYPDRLAIKTGSHGVTYQELNNAANQVARAILALRGELEEPVALLFDQSTQVIVAILGALKAGKIYVPLDSSYPQARIKYMLEDSQAALIVTNTRNLSLARELAQNRC